MTGLVWSLEWDRARSRRRLLYLNVAVPMALVTPVALGRAPVAHAAVAYATLFVFFGTFGSAIPLVRDAASGLLTRLALTGLRPRALVLERVFAGTALDGLQLLPSLFVIGWVGGADPLGFLTSVGAVVLTILTANVIGVWVAAAARSLAEAALFGAVLSLLALHGSGVFRAARPGSVAAIAEALSPYAVLHEALLHLAGSSVASDTLSRAAAGLGWALGGCLVTAATAPWILRRLAGKDVA